MVLLADTLLEPRNGPRSWLVARVVRQAVALKLDQLLSHGREEKTVAAHHVLDSLLFSSHICEPHVRLLCDVGARDLHRNLLVCLLHLRHVDQLVKQIHVHREHIRVLFTGTKLDLLVVQEVYFVDEAGQAASWLRRVLARYRGQLVQLCRDVLIFTS